MDLELADSKAICTPMYSIYIEVDSCDKLLLSEGACHHLGIIHYQEDITSWKRRRKKLAVETSKLYPVWHLACKLPQQEGVK